MFLNPWRFGHLYTDFTMDWDLDARTTQEFLLNCLPVQPNHLVNVDGFDVGMLKLRHVNFV